MKVERILNSVGPVSLILFAFLTTLRVTEYIELDWFWIASPLWIGFFCLFGVVYISLKNKERNKSKIQNIQ